ncbi:MAG TPA: TetR/AcrR family transcriptional regulator [Solirubrobacteraceae bacterium]|nr:TetR/AcrR family transcriptional regulator [Solirubrobacteraceae bacterium]
MSATASDQILDAARATVLDFGVRRTTVSEVARRAGLSRMTVYRQYPDGAELMRALMTREFGGLLVRAREETDGLASGRERLVAAAIRTIELLMTHPLMLRLLELDPEMLLPYLTERIGRFQELAREAVAAGMAEGQADGSVRGGDPLELAAACELAVRGVVIGARSLSARQREAALGEMTAMLDRYLRP